ncbi:Gfo/Idh/MocA family protein [Tabrizicola sp.]|uniref:Gfo/Idh/MocA family protein n=1 Tax=Tabrizicola sp. TaxID=2005166 RepID=UPI003F330507
MTLRGALIGCGFFARNHMQAWADIEGVQIAAVCDTDPAKAQSFADAFGAEPYTDATTMLAAVKPDFADIVTTVSSHRALVELAARHSRAVICQKPFAETMADGQAMVEACDNAGIPLLVHENFRWQAPYRALGAALSSGVIGAPTFLRLSFRHAFDIYANQPYLAGIDDLALTDVGLHLFDMARFLMGDVTRVHCQTQRLNPRVKGQDAFLATLRHASGAVTSVECSFFSHYAPDPFVQTLAVAEGPLGSIELLEGYRMRLHKDGQVVETDTEPVVPGWGEKPWHLVQESVIAFQTHARDVMRGLAQAQPSGADNLRTLAVTLAAIQSSKSGQSVVLDGGAVT